MRGLAGCLGATARAACQHRSARARPCRAAPAETSAGRAVQRMCCVARCFTRTTAPPAFTPCPYLPQQLDAQLICCRAAAALAKHRLAVAALGARVAAHVFHQAQQRHVHLAKHLRATPGDGVVWVAANKKQHSTRLVLAHGGAHPTQPGSAHTSAQHTHLASNSATSCGVDTMTAPDSGSRWPNPICASPVPAACVQVCVSRHRCRLSDPQTASWGLSGTATSCRPTPPQWHTVTRHAVTGRHVDDEDVQVAPSSAHEESVNRLVHDGAPPHHWRVVLRAARDVMVCAQSKAASRVWRRAHAPCGRIQSAWHH
jgi:plastocyanin